LARPAKRQRAKGFCHNKDCASFLFVFVAPKISFPLFLQNCFVEEGHRVSHLLTLKASMLSERQRAK
jgi:hypothetical protein